MQSVRNAMSETVSKTVDLGADTERRIYSAHSSAYDYPPVRVWVDKNRATGGVYATSEAILFQEFGAGIGAIHPDGSEYGFTPASWSSKYGTGEFARYGSWHYQGKKWVGIPPAMAWYEAYKEMYNNVDKIFAEVWKW